MKKHRKISTKEQLETFEVAYRNAQIFFGLSADKLGWFKMRKAFSLFENGEISRRTLCERVMVVLFTIHNGFTRSKFP